MTLERCAWIEERLEAYLSEALAPAEEDRVARHLTACAACSAEAALAARVEFELGELPQFDLPPERVERIKRLARQSEPSTLSSARRLWPAALAAGLLAAALITWWPATPTAGPTAAEVAAAEREARYALALVAQIGRKTGTQLRDDVLLERVAAPVAGGVGRSFNRAPRGGQG